MNRQEIEDIIKEPHFRKIIQESDFYFLKGQKALKNWLQLELREQMKDDLIRLSSDYTQFLEIAEINPEIEKIKEILFEIIAYCDNRAKDKSKYNQYDDDRILADASVRMGNWVEGLVKFKFKPTEITGKSILNAFNYLLVPQDNCTILSDNHRRMVSVNLLDKDYYPSNFIQDLQAFFDQYKLTIQNQDNYTYLLSSLVYAFKTEWVEEVIGLMASDGTGWQEDAIILEPNFQGLVTWNSKKPSGGQKTLNFLKDKIKEGQSFPLYYNSKGQVEYKANITDFAISQKELSSKNWGNKSIKHYQSNFGDYKDDKKKAHILFLAESIEKISPKPISDFKFLGKFSKPTQDNLSPIKEIKNDEEIIKPGLRMIKNLNIALNQILFGPPGTGKTYETISEAVKIVDPEFYEENHNSRSELKKRFAELLFKDEKSDDWQIAFTTFHQSFSYEDFVEGIKPVMGETQTGDVSYEIQEGIFKRICRMAADNIESTKNRSTHLISLTESAFQQAQFYKMSLGNTQNEVDNEIYEYCIQNNCVTLGFGNGDDFSGLDERELKNLGQQKGLESFTIQSLNMFKNYVKIGNYVVISNGNTYVRAIGRITGEYEYEEVSPLPNHATFNHFRKVHWFFVDKNIPASEIYNRNLSQQSIYKLEKKEIKPPFFVKEDTMFDTAEMPVNSPKNYVLIIDEINRGNVSAIFGELITLLEKDKRAGNDEELSVLLPYSKTRFTVPKNVFVIGTMNTADRSVESLDTALRRRFSFREIAPQPSVISKVGSGTGFTENGVDLTQLLVVINNRIELLIDKDHKIGHAYFLGIESESDLIQVFENKVIPLLEEYFFGDFGKIGLVLGDSFVEKKPTENTQFARFTAYDNGIYDDLANREVFRIKEAADWDFKAVYA